MRTSSTAGFDLRDAVDGLREAFAPRDGSRGERDARAAILVELAVEPMHGYQLIQAIDARSGGAWTPTAGVVYPALQLLADEGLVSAAQEGERKVWSLTDAGRAQAAARPGEAESEQRRGPDLEKALALPKAGARLAQAMSGFGPGIPAEQVERAVAIVDEARRKLYAILAED